MVCSQSGAILTPPPRNICACLKTHLVVTTGERAPGIQWVAAGTLPRVPPHSQLLTTKTHPAQGSLCRLKTLFYCTYAHMHQNGIHLLLMDIHTFNFSSLQIGLWSLSCCELHGVGSRVSETRKLSFFTPRGLHPAARRPSPHHETNIALRHTIALWISCGLP